jgi:hypothetical protein
MTYTFHANKETILFYAWLCSREHLRSAVRMKDKEPWKRSGREKIVQQILETAVAQVDASHFYGAILRYGASKVDADTVRAVLDESGAIYFKEETLEDTEEQEAFAREVTALLLESIKGDIRVRHNLQLLCQRWTDESESSVAGASALRDFFLLHACMWLSEQGIASFVQEIVYVQLQQVNWYEIRARVLRQALPNTSTVSLHEVMAYARHEAATSALLEESLWQIGLLLEASAAAMAQDTQELNEQVLSARHACSNLAHWLSIRRTMWVSAGRGILNEYCLF